MPGITVKDLLRLESMKNFRVVAGSRGLDRPVDYVEILDYEFTKGAKMNRRVTFEGRSIVLTSLLFAKDEPELILDAVIKLRGFNVSAMAYKRSFFSKLPDDVLEYADREGFAILEFGGDEFFERIIFDILSAVNSDDKESLREQGIRRLIEDNLDRQQVREISLTINPSFRRYALAVSVREEDSEFDGRIMPEPDRRLTEKTALIRYGKGFILILTQDECRSESFYALLEDMCAVYGIMSGRYFMGKSRIGLTESLDTVVKEAVWARIAGEAEERSMTDFADMGIYQVIASLQDNAYAEHFSASRIELIRSLDKEGENGFLDTAAAYVKAEGDMERAAELAFCHRNTVRYRIRKIREKMNCESSEKEFYSELAFAIKYHLYMKKM